MSTIWTSTADLPEFPALDGDLHTDVLIIGGGLAGLLCAYYLQQAGINAALIEAGTLLGGVSGRTTAKITSQHGFIYHKLLRSLGTEKARMYLQANETAIREYRALAGRFDFDFQTEDAFLYTRRNPQHLEREQAALQAIGYNADWVDVPALPFETAGALRFPDQAQCNPLRLAAALCRNLKIYTHTAARSYEKGTIITDRGKIRAEAIIVATHFPLFNKHGSYFLKMYQQRSYVLALEGVPPLPGIYSDEASDGLNFRSFREALLITCGSHRTGKPSTGWDRAADFAARYYPDAVPVSRWATQDCITLDNVPYIGQYSASTPNLYVATGFNKWGMTFSMAAALMLQELLTDRASVWEPLFSPSRSMLRPQLAVNAAESVRNLLTFSRPRCPHLGCALHWNPREHSWDCPCHGSRFSEAGKLLSNPATGNLPRKPK